MFENDDQKETYDQYMARKRKEREIEDKVQSIMERADEKKQKQIYLAERDAYCERMRQEELAKSNSASATT